MSDPVLLAIDGGNSKTDVALVRTDGSVLAAVRGPGSSPHRIGLDGSMRVVDTLVQSACAHAGISPNGAPIAAIGTYFIAGADLPAEERALRHAVESQAWAAHNHVANDTFAILRAGADVGRRLRSHGPAAGETLLHRQRGDDRLRRAAEERRRHRPSARHRSFTHRLKPFLRWPVPCSERS